MFLVAFFLISSGFICYLILQKRGCKIKIDCWALLNLGGCMWFQRNSFKSLGEAISCDSVHVLAGEKMRPQIGVSLFNQERCLSFCKHIGLLSC